MKNLKRNDRCRIFIKDNENISWQLFSLAQNKKDGSIYLGSPEFHSFEWLTFKSQDGTIMPFKLSQDTNGHLSVHGSGQMHIMCEDHNCRLMIKGQHLLRPAEKEISLRHLFTMFPKKPEFMPVSAASRRNGDQVMVYNKKMQPFVIMGFAIPSMGLRISFSMAFHVDDIETVPPDTGWFLFSLIHHDILLFVYRTKYMNEWPKKTMIQYLDGVSIPVFLGRPEGRIEMRICSPTYELIDKQLSISLQSAPQEDA